MTNEQAERKKSITVSDVAAAAGVSTQTVSRVINNSDKVHPTTRNKVEQAIRRLNYRPNRAARSLASRRSYTLGLVLSDVANPYYPEIVKDVEKVAADAGYGVMLTNTDNVLERERKALQLLEENRVDGIILCAARLSDNELIRYLKRQRAAVVINRIVSHALAGVVRVDFAAGMIAAVNHLLASDKHHLLYLGYESNAYYSNPTRKAGFTQAISDNHRHVRSEYVPASAPNVDGGYTITQKTLKKHPDIDAIIGFNDLVAIGALQACRDLNKQVPEEIAIIGCDDIQMARFVTPALTTIGVSQSQIGRTAGRMLIDRIEQRDVTGEIVVKPQLIVRDSAP